MRAARWALISTAVLILLPCLGCSPTSNGTTEAAPRDTVKADADVAPFGYDAYDTLLAAYVDENGLVDYASLKENRSDLDGFIASMGALDPGEFDAWSEDERLAFWINAYNAITLQRIIDHYPIQRGGIISGLRFPDNSIRQIDGVWTKLTTPVLGEDRTLDAIEHEILRVEFEEPRIHAAIVCAAIGCPPLRDEAFVAEELSDQLDDQSRKYLGAEHRFRIDREQDVVRLSPILKWFAEDFVGVYNVDGTISGHGEEKNAALDYVRRYVSEADADYILHEDYAVDFLKYDWTLNEQP